MKKAVAVKYKPEKKSDAPKVIAKGFGNTAESIIEKAQELGISTYKDPDTVEILSKINLGDDIPEELFEVIAEILVFAYKMNDEYPEWMENKRL